MKIVIIGSGNVAWHMAKICKEKSHHLLQLVNVHSKKISNLFDRFQVPYIYSFNDINMHADIYILAIKDSELQNIQLPIFKEKQLVLHTSGTTAIDVIAKFSNNFGCLYPLQSFTKGIDVDFSNVPILIEASNVYTKNCIEQFANSLSNKVQYLSSEKRVLLHLNAVIVNNFTNHLFHQSQEFLQKNDIDINLLLPLIEETVNKLKIESAYTSQTGPARRNDKNTILKHEKLLTEHPKLLEIYQLLTASIIQTYPVNES